MEQEVVGVNEDLVKTIGHQTIQIDWLKKSSGSPNNGEAGNDEA